MIEHVFVLMLENRSFDQLLGFSRIEGTDPSGRATRIDGVTGEESNASPEGATVRVSAPADFMLEHGPGHEFKDVREQLCGRRGAYSSPPPAPGETDPNIRNSGFVTNYSVYEHKDPAKVMQCYLPSQLPVLTTLAREFSVCDRWFSSMPGPTWPNRFFVHAGSSGGLDDSPSFKRELGSIVHDGFKFDNGTIFDRLESAGRDWAVYCDDEFPQSLSISGMASRQEHFKEFRSFRRDLGDAGFSTSYVFIEPDYHAFTGKFRGGNSQHPVDDVTSGERLLKETYEAIRSSPLWEKSLFVLTYDEHGGFYDHVAPPAAVAPGDSVTDKSNNHNNFSFHQLGLRVPTVIVSPYVRRGLIDHTVHDHTSVLATVERIFKLDPLTQRDRSANALNHLLNLSTPRADAPSTLPEPAASGYFHREDDEGFVARTAARVISWFNPGVLDPSLAGFHHVAHLRRIQGVSPEERERLTRKFVRHGNVSAVRYMKDVRREVAKGRVDARSKRSAHRGQQSL